MIRWQRAGRGALGGKAPVRLTAPGGVTGLFRWLKPDHARRGWRKMRAWPTGTERVVRVW